MCAGLVLFCAACLPAPPLSGQETMSITVFLAGPRSYSVGVDFLSSGNSACLSDNTNVFFSGEPLTFSAFGGTCTMGSFFRTFSSTFFDPMKAGSSMSLRAVDPSSSVLWRAEDMVQLADGVELTTGDGTRLPQTGGGVWVVDRTLPLRVRWTEGPDDLGANSQVAASLTGPTGTETLSATGSDGAVSLQLNAFGNNGSGVLDVAMQGGGAFGGAVREVPCEGGPTCMAAAPWWEIRVAVELVGGNDDI